MSWVVQGTENVPRNIFSPACGTFFVVEAKWFAEKRGSEDREAEKGDAFSPIAFVPL